MDKKGLSEFEKHISEMNRIQSPGLAIFNQLGLFYHSAFESPSNFSEGGTDDYWKLMHQRPSFFLFLLETIQIDFFFVDADVVFFRDPFPWITGNKGFGIDNVVNGSLYGSYQGHNTFYHNHGPDNYKMTPTPKGYSIEQGWDQAVPCLEEDPHLNIEPDLVISLDPRALIHDLNDPWEGQSRVPKICGGMFYVKSNTRTISLYRLLYHHIAEDGSNDQHGLDDILNDPKLLKDVLRVG